MSIQSLKDAKTNLEQKLEQNENDLARARVRYKLIKKELYKVEDELVALKEIERDLREKIQSINFNLD